MGGPRAGIAKLDTSHVGLPRWCQQASTSSRSGSGSSEHDDAEQVAKGTAGESTSELGTLGDVFVELVDSVHNLREENRELRADIKDLSTQLATVDSRVAANHRDCVHDINGVGKEVLGAVSDIGVFPDAHTIKTLVLETIDARLPLITAPAMPAPRPKSPSPNPSTGDSLENESDGVMHSDVEDLEEQPPKARREQEQPEDEGKPAGELGEPADPEAEPTDGKSASRALLDALAEIDATEAPGDAPPGRVPPAASAGLAAGTPRSVESPMPSTPTSVAAGDSISQVGAHSSVVAARTRHKKLGKGDGADAEPADDDGVKKRKAPPKGGIAEAPPEHPQDDNDEGPAKKRKVGVGQAVAGSAEEPQRSPAKPTRGSGGGRGRGVGRRGK